MSGVGLRVIEERAVEDAAQRARPEDLPAAVAARPHQLSRADAELAGIGGPTPRLAARRPDGGGAVRVHVYRLNGLQEAEYVGTYDADERLLLVLLALLAEGRPVFIEPEKGGGGRA